MKKTLLCTAIAMACAAAYAEDVFTLGQIEVIADKSTDLSTSRTDQADLQKITKFAYLMWPKPHRVYF